MASFIEDLDVMLDVFGMENGDYAWYFAQIPFDDDDQRDLFIRDMGGMIPTPSRQR